MRKKIEHPLHVRVAETQGWSHSEIRKSGPPIQVGRTWVGYPPHRQIVGRKVEVPHFDSDVSLLGQLIIHNRIGVQPIKRDGTFWGASDGDGDREGFGKTPSEAVCNFLVGEES